MPETTTTDIQADVSDSSPFSLGFPKALLPGLEGSERSGESSWDWPPTHTLESWPSHLAPLGLLSLSLSLGFPAYEREQ